MSSTTSWRRRVVEGSRIHTFSKHRYNGYVRRMYLLLFVGTLACGCLKKPPGEFDFIPILKGLKPAATQGDLKTGRTDEFLL